MGALIMFGLLGSAQAQMSQADWCRMQSMGLTQTVKTFRGLKQPVAVGLEQAGLAAGGPRHRLATLAWQRLDAGASEGEATEAVRAACMREGFRALQDDDPTFGSKPQGAEAQLCSDLAVSLSGYLSGDPDAVNRELAQALDEFAPREHDDNAPRPRLGEALRLAQQFARGNSDQTAIQAFALKHCRSLDAQARAQLDKEFYAP